MLLVFILGGLGCVCLGRGLRDLRGTTLVAPWCWAVMALAWIVIVEAIGVRPPPSVKAWLVHARFVGGVLSLTPLLALLGARRPHHLAWQWIVATLFVILIVPSGAALLLRDGAAPTPHLAWRSLLGALIVIEWLNHVFTRHGLACSALACAQVFWLADYLPWAPFGLGKLPTWAGLALAVAAIAWAARPRLERRAPRTEMDLLFLDFRDRFGMLWALRIGERFNTSAALNGWPFRLRWNGFCNISASTSHETDEQTRSHPAASTVARRAPEGWDPPMTQCFDSLLRRFVSPEWIDRRPSQT